ncbi:MAG: hypothetical protein Q8R15_01195 [Candidatus Micrarchaeota archaeon]|nr:hypothetical protein [Candidatus Micrarchaeota archaeon]
MKSRNEIEFEKEFARRTEAAFKRYERGLFKEMSKADFLEELKKW